MYAVGIATASLTELANFSNQGPVPVITGSNVEEFQSLITAIVSEQVSGFGDVAGFLTTFSEGVALTFKNVSKKNFRERLDRDRRTLPQNSSIDGYWDTRFINEEEVLLTFDLMDEAERFSLLSFAFTLRGQQRTFWMAAPNRDYILASTMTVNNEMVLRRSMLDSVDRIEGGWLHIERKNLPAVFRRIESVVPVAGTDNMLITLNAPLPWLLTPAQVAIISRMFRYRATTDRFTLQHENHRQSRVSMTCLRIR
jgi:hypothetical protein